MGQWVHQQSSTMYLNRGIKWWFIVCCPEKQTSKKHIWVGPIFVHSSHLLLCVDSKSSPGHTHCVQRYPYISLFDQETGWMTSLYYFHPLSFLFVPSLMYYILNSSTPTLFLVWTKYKIRLHEVALPLKIEEKNRWRWTIRSRGLRGRKWCTCSDVASWGSRAKAVS